MSKKIWWLKKWWFLRASLKEIGNIIALIFISYLSILINVFLIYGIKNDTLAEILQRQDILNVILTTGISMLAGILLLEFSKEREKIRKGIIITIIINCLIALIISIILTIQIEISMIFFNVNLIYSVTLFCFVFTLIVVFRSNYSLQKVNETVSVQLSATKSRNVEKVKVDDEEYKL
ncbi:hypothetical protein BN1080_02838 [Planococcus massiliensis]|uniref:Uncharacterized protein n=1 Tax=Planococcus massiliensis TaxID=1499687 RepID=A0A098ERA6_9BACL|nr:hypothetical protein [Planococcus massiliensis]CEG23831.1 hypothetical protein BN1080_02838 [Planococcus massiliensis]